MNTNIIKWLRGEDTGSSSLTIVAIMEMDATVAAMNHYHGQHPRDPADLGRCIRLLDIEPTYRANLSIMASISPQWRVLVDHWAELEALYREELPAGRAPKCYQRMFGLLNPDVHRDWEAEEKHYQEREKANQDY